MGDELVAGLDGAGEAGLVLLDVGGVAAGEGADNLEAGRVPRVQAVHDGAAKAHLLAGLGRGVERVVVAVEAVEERRLGRRLVVQHGVGLLVLGRRVADRGRALGAVPVALADEEGARVDARVDIVVVRVDQLRLDVEHGAGLALVVDADDLGPGLKVAAGRGCGQRLQELHLALAVDDASIVELGDAGDLGGLAAGVKVNDFLRVALESCNKSQAISVGLGTGD